MRTSLRLLSALSLAFIWFVSSSAPSAQGGRGGGVAQFIKVAAGKPVVLTHARVIDGTGALARADQTIVIRDGNIAALGRTGDVTAPPDATVIDLTGKSVIPGLVMLHEHLYYPTGPNVYGQLGVSFARLYLAGGVTTMRTAGNTNGLMDINLKQGIEAGRQAGPAIDATAPYLEGPNTQLQMHALKDADDARRQVDYWADMGATSFKAYMNITRAELGAAIDEAHKRGLKLTGHLCSVTLSEAADLGIDDIEHAFMAATDLVATKQPDVCPGQAVGQRTIADLDPDGAPFRALVQKLVQKHVALTSTLTVFETFTPGRPMPPGLDVLLPDLRTSFEQAYARVNRPADAAAAPNQSSAGRAGGRGAAANAPAQPQAGGARGAQGGGSVYATLFPKGMKLEYAFAKAGGFLVAGTDPTGSGGVIPGYSNQRQIELLVEAGFTPLEAISICTLNGAKYLGREARIGSIALGKQADLVVVAGDPSTSIADVRNVELVFKAGVGFDPGALIASVKGKVGLW